MRASAAVSRCVRARCARTHASGGRDLDDHPFTRKILNRFKSAEVVKVRDTARTHAAHTVTSFVICVHNQNHSTVSDRAHHVTDPGHRTVRARAHTMTMEERKDGTVPYRTVHHRNT